MDGLGLGIFGGNAVSTGANFGAQAWSQDFAKEMYRNRYQWAVRDLRKAGLNPILAAGMNPATPSAGMASSAGDLGELIQKNPVMRAQAAASNSAAAASEAQAEINREEAKIRGLYRAELEKDPGLIRRELELRGTGDWQREILKKIPGAWKYLTDGLEKMPGSGPPREADPDAKPFTITPDYYRMPDGSVVHKSDLDDKSRSRAKD